MTLPRQVIPGTAYMLQRRCAQRQFLLQPSDEVTQVFIYCLALAAQRHGIEVFTFVVLANHYHLGIVDPMGRLPLFAALFHSLVARALNVHYRRGESFWAPGSFSAVTLADDAAVLDKIVYMITNPVAAGLVDRVEDWPGLVSLPGDLCRRELVAKKPDFFFRRATGQDDSADENAAKKARRHVNEREVLPVEVRLKLSRPPGFEDLSDDQIRELVARRVVERVQEIQRERRAKGNTAALGVKAIRQQRWTDDPGSTRPKFRLNPRLACKDKWRRASLCNELKTFWREHKEASVRFRSGERRVLFPFGSYGYPTNFRARCREKPAVAA
jgi:putative transposase